ncbi:proto-oncogene Mas-like [Sceloporus undulatus]|uniref:proto-oncogene Mas-like n=1 Tax=Sceloporus undulatus TaxID=8520 RepID=UPI001C4DAC9C|nr:proto-oncogene Mas-like [Sceloporus undulatus]
MTKYTVYILNIAIADFIVLLYQYTYFMLFLQPTHLSGSASHFLELMYSLGNKSGFCILTTACLERCFSVFPPICYLFQRPKHLSVIICIMLWIVCGIISFVEYLACYPRFYAYLDEDSYSCYVQTIFRMVLAYMILIPIMTFSTLAIFIRMLQKAHETTPVTFDFTLIAIVILYLVFEASVRLLNTLEYWYDTIGVPIFTISVLFDTVSSSVNVFFIFRHWLLHSEKV